MTLKEKMFSGEMYEEFGNDSAEDKAFEEEIARQRQHCKERVMDFNNTRPTNVEAKRAILQELLGSMGKDAWVEAPLHISYGCNTYIGNHFYANFNLTIVDDIDVHIGDHVLLGPNVMISVTGHPLHGEDRRRGGQFSKPVHIGNDVWIGGNVCIMPGVTIGSNVVIGAGSVVTRDIPDNSLAFGVPCRVVRAITDADRLPPETWQ